MYQLEMENVYCSSTKMFEEQFCSTNFYTDFVVENSFGVSVSCFVALVETRYTVCSCEKHLSTDRFFFLENCFSLRK